LPAGQRGAGTVDRVAARPGGGRPAGSARRALAGGRQRLPGRTAPAAPDGFAHAGRGCIRRERRWRPHGIGYAPAQPLFRRAVERADPARARSGAGARVVAVGLAIGAQRQARQCSRRRWPAGLVRRAGVSLVAGHPTGGCRAVVAGRAAAGYGRSQAGARRQGRHRVAPWRGTRQRGAGGHGADRTIRQGRGDAAAGTGQPHGTLAGQSRPVRAAADQLRRAAGGRRHPAGIRDPTQPATGAAAQRGRARPAQRWTSGRPTGTGRFPMTDAPDEIGDLARSFEKLFVVVGGYTDYLRTLASKLSHELNTPLAIVKSSLDNLEHALQERAALPDQAVPYLARARDGVARLGALVRAMSESSRMERSIEAAEPEDVDLCDVVRGCAEVYRPLIGARRLTCELPATALYLHGAPELIAQALDKLLD